MNKVILSGRLTRNAVASGNGTKAVKFTLAAKYGYDPKEKSDRVEFVPCVLFAKEAEKLGDLLVKEGKGMLIELEGRVATSTFEKAGETAYRTEVVVNKSTLNILPTGNKQ